MLSPVLWASLWSEASGVLLMRGQGIYVVAFFDGASGEGVTLT